MTGPKGLEVGMVVYLPLNDIEFIDEGDGFNGVDTRAVVVGFWGERLGIVKLNPCVYDVRDGRMTILEKDDGESCFGVYAIARLVDEETEWYETQKAALVAAVDQEQRYQDECAERISKARAALGEC